jgi:hypothetical protein
MKDTFTPAEGTEQPTTESRASERNKTPERPYVWAAKRALEAINGHPEVKDRSNALLVYLGLAWIASDLREGTFQTTKGLLAHKTGLGTRTVADALYDLERAGVIVIHRSRKEGTKHNETNVYTLCSFCTTGNANNGGGKLHKARAKKGEAPLHTCLTTPLTGGKYNKSNSKEAPLNAAAELPSGIGDATGGAPEPHDHTTEPTLEDCIGGEL